MAARDPDERSYISRKAALTALINTTPETVRTRMAHARDVLRQQLIAEIDPTGELAVTNPDELERQLDLHRRLQMAEMGRRSARARREHRETSRREQEAVEWAALLIAGGHA